MLKRDRTGYVVEYHSKLNKNISDFYKFRKL